MALSGNFFSKFSQDLELIYAKYSRSFDGSAEFSLKVCDLPENVKQIEKVLLENIRSPKHEQWQSNHDSSSQDSCLANSSYSSDENLGFMSYHKDEENGHVFTTPVGSSDEESSSSPYYESNDILRWESGCSGSEEATNPMVNNKSPDLFVEKSNKPAKTFPSPSKTVSLKRRPNKDRNNSSSHDTGGAIPSNIYKKTSPSSHDSRLVACTQTRERRRKQTARNTPNEDKSSVLRMGINVGSALRECPCEEMCSTLLTAVHKFQNLVSNVLLLSRDNQKHSQDLAIPSPAVSEKENDEACFKKISQCLHGKQKFLDDQEKKQCIDIKSRKSPDFQQPMCVVEKLFARPKGSAEDSFIEVASRQFLNNNTEIRCSADENDNLRHACSGLLSAPAITKLGKNKGRVRSAIYNTNHKSPLFTEASLDEGVSSPGVNGGDSFRDAKRYSTWSRSTPLRDSPVENSGSEPDHNVRSLRHGQKNALDPRLGSPRAILPLQNDWGVSLGYEKYNANDVKRWRTIRNKVPTINGVISLDIKTTRETQCCTPLQGSPSSEDTNERPKSLRDISPLLTRCQDGGMISPGVESCGTGRRSVPLRATPGCDNVMRTSDHMTLGLLHQTSTPDDKRADWRADERKVETKLSSDPKTFFKQRKIPQPRRSLMAPGNLTPGDSTPSPIRPLSSSQRDQSADKSSACTFETRERGRPTGTHDDHVGDSRRRLYSPRMGQTSEATQRAQSTVPLPVSETGGRKTAPRTPQGPGLAGKHFDRFSSNDENPRSPHSLKIKSTPRRNSTGCHPYARYSPSSRRESPSLASPLQALRILSPSSSCDETARWSTLRHSTGKRPIMTYENRSEKPGLLFKKEKRLKKKNNFDHTEECEVTHDCSQGNCTKKFCFNCSMDYS